MARTMDGNNGARMMLLLKPLVPFRGRSLWRSTTAKQSMQSKETTLMKLRFSKPQLTTSKQQPPWPTDSKLSRVSRASSLPRL